MIFQLEDGGHTKVFFFKDDAGAVHSFPSYNADIVRSRGNKESKEILNRILKSGDALHLIVRNHGRAP